MARVFIPVTLRPLTDGHEVVEVGGSTVRRVIDALEDRHPGMQAYLRDGDQLRSGLSVVVDGTVAPMGLLQHVEEDSEVHFLPAISGGR